MIRSQRPRFGRPGRLSKALGGALTAVLLLVAMTSPVAAAPARGPAAIVSNELATTLGEPDALRFPADDSAHEGNFVEWWQWWVHLHDDHGRRFDAVVVFYQFPFSPAEQKLGKRLRRTDVRITDTARGSAYSFSTWAYEPPYPSVPNGFDLRSRGQFAQGSGGNDNLRVATDGYVLDLHTSADRAAIPITADNGLNRVDPLEALQIYERWRMPTNGTLSFQGRNRPVQGTTWFEHGWGNAVSLVSIQWDYFQLELADGRDMLVVQVRRAGGLPHFAFVGGIRDRSGRVTRLGEGDFTVTPTGTWRRGKACRYPSGWKVTVKGERFVVTPTAKNQEIRSLYGNFWDGDVSISGAVNGRGVAELLNYCYVPQPQAQLGTAAAR